MSKEEKIKVSIPLKSGLFVISVVHIKLHYTSRLNPLEIGSICNNAQEIAKEAKELKGLNPLEIGSICNRFRMVEAKQTYVSIPLKSGLFVI